ncbi:GNAT family N-acetyltransferase [Oceanobacillus neutriphilus]|uniref:N-acetyltransferase n=1 Tax=Oceanobacillus neutriphilus TaxID=531815 RepID=A0ABQ2P1S4_9BACI|nr:GNAT family N-acetyltransferase [Oceanobacillus neutriphilus]GGP16121.1 N-acetyltransferase [Oceanobacillus neutriphilus]
MEIDENKLQSETERLVLRPLKNGDYNRWLEGCRDRLPSQYKYDDDKMDLSGWTQEKFNDKVVSKFKEYADRDEVYVFGIFRKSDQKQLGKVELETIIRDEFQWGLLGYTIHNQFWRNGYGKEAVKAALNIAFKNLAFHRIEAHINIDNEPSLKLAKSVGMKFECIRKGFIFEFGAWTDNMVFYMNSK